MHTNMVSKKKLPEKKKFTLEKLLCVCTCGLVS